MCPPAEAVALSAHRHTYADRRHPEFVVLDIGGDVGALIVHADASQHGLEVEISPTGQDGRRSHKEILERRQGERPAYTAVFDCLAAGTYTLWTAGRPRTRGVRVTGARVAEVDWRTSVR